ncbi:hypothetical protein MMC19_006336 [Ptychographa xylographoides]|nr:hypothetical protein [Ptychographa xylographoides]
MPDSRSRSPPPGSERRRSRSPRQRRNGDRPRQGGGGGFRWKEKRRDEEPQNGGEEKRLERGYRDRNQDRPRSPVRDQSQVDPRTEKAVERPKREKKEKREKKAGPVPTGEPMIIVNVNDRLGTKASIPCLASDSVKLFKAQVAAQIGRQPHEIMLKRQGERPFKDALTLEDYGVSNGVQLDLELDTGD